MCIDCWLAQHQTHSQGAGDTVGHCLAENLLERLGTEHRHGCGVSGVSLARSASKHTHQRCERENGAKEGLALFIDWG